MPNLWLQALRNHQVYRRRPGMFHVGAGRIKVGVVGNGLSCAADDREQNALRRPALVRRNDMGVPGELLHRGLKAVKAVAAGIGVIAAHHRRPLLG